MEDNKNIPPYNPEEYNTPPHEDGIPSLGEILPETYQEVVERNTESELVAARRRLISIQNERAHGNAYDSQELEQVNERVMQLEAQAREQNSPPA